MNVAFVIYPGFTALDLTGPYEVISRWPGAEVRFVATTMDPVRCDRGLTVLPTDTPATIGRPELIVVPGSEHPLPVLEDRCLVSWIADAAPGCRWTASVCTGAGLYAAAGLLGDKTVTTHWGFRDPLRAMGVTVSPDRVVWDGRHISGAGVSAGIDLALTLTERVFGRPLAETLQLVIEYDPQPPFDAGDPEKVDAGTLRMALRILLGDRPLRAAARIQRHGVAARLARARAAAVAAARRGHAASRPAPRRRPPPRSPAPTRGPRRRGR
ncbi:MAG TPA: DJ-1/PfpI family protein [Baekduia sp.]|uniref:DJ-1/PfpI family protein n=1 Tax=Baekduia sp. TaxID=2600305 RepID=UPI002D776D4C|nr:DJ-1/PfpI family protein [Baekduia sp.]HET6505358.1 DJ-1/PfpI family protein [Baekduia sp.]